MSFLIDEPIYKIRHRSQDGSNVESNKVISTNIDFYWALTFEFFSQLLELIMLGYFVFFTKCVWVGGGNSSRFDPGVEVLSRQLWYIFQDVRGADWALWQSWQRRNNFRELTDLEQHLAMCWCKTVLFYYFHIIAYSVPVRVLSYKHSCCQMQWSD